MRIWLIAKPPADEERRQALDRAETSLKAQGHEVRAELTDAAGAATRLARAAAEEGADLVIAAGGDGTINEVVNGLARATVEPLLAILPLGTANDFAQGVGISSDIDEAVKVALGGVFITIDLAAVNDRCFINVSTGGFGVDVTEETRDTWKQKLGKVAYLLKGATKLIDLETQRARFTADGKVIYDGDFMFFAVGNARQTGGGTEITPLADFRDRRLDLVIVPAMARLKFVALLPDVRSGDHIEHPDVLYLQAAEIEVESNGPLAVHADGEAVHAERFRYRLLERRLSLMVP